MELNTARIINDKSWSTYDIEYRNGECLTTFKTTEVHVKNSKGDILQEIPVSEKSEGFY